MKRVNDFDEDCRALGRYFVAGTILILLWVMLFIVGAACAETVGDSLLNNVYGYQDSSGQSCEIDFLPKQIIQIECTEVVGNGYEKDGKLYPFGLTQDVIIVNGQRFVVGASGNIYLLADAPVIIRK